ncbi:MAG TPA: hypothetical protein VMB23_09145 [Spirochaetia bacterium]|jgi:hypothetical protein|nr:hypothetical protein [Spirochaetia bacterium]
MKKGLLILAVALLAVGSLAAQAKPFADTKIFALEMGTGFSYDLGAKASNPTQTVSAIFGLSDVVQAGFSIIKGDTNAHSFNLVKIVVFPLADVGVNLDLGSDSTFAMVSGFGLGYNVFRNSSGTLTTALQVNAQYLFNDISKGNLGLGLNLKVGL